MNEKLVSVLAEVFNLQPDQIAPELTKDDVGNWDSLKQMDLVMSLERQFGVSLEIEDIAQLVSVAKIVEVLERKGINFGD
jgi:acyl carrier protein